MAKSDELLKLGRRIKLLREEQGLTQEQLAFACELDRTYISDLERGNRNLSYLGLIKLAKGLNTTISRMLAHIDDVPPTN
jgi:transcriptional regulator with XRE-family HTH domain